MNIGGWALREELAPMNENLSPTHGKHGDDANASGSDLHFGEILCHALQWVGVLGGVGLVLVGSTGMGRELLGMAPTGDGLTFYLLAGVLGGLAWLGHQAQRQWLAMDGECRRLQQASGALGEELTQCRLRMRDQTEEQRMVQLEREQACGEARELARLFKRYGALLPGVMVVLDERGRIQRALGMVEDFFAVGPERLQGALLEEWVASGSKKECRGFLDEVRRSSAAQTHQAQLSCGADPQRAISLFARVEAETRQLILLMLDTARITLHEVHKCPMHLHLFDGKNGEEPVIKALARIDQISAGQLEGTVEETRIAANNIFSSAVQVRDDMDGMGRFLEDTQNRLRGFGLHMNRQDDRDDQALQVLSEFLASLDGQRVREKKRAEAVSGEVNDLRKLAEMVMDLSERSRMLALNARITASRAGEMGKKFTVVAEEIGTLAIQTGTMARNIDDGISRAAESVEQALLERFESTEARKELERMQQVAVHVERLKEQFHALMEFNQESFGKMTDLQGGVSHKLMGLISQLQFQDIVRQRIEQVVGTLQRKQAFLESLQACVDKGGCHGQELTEFRVDEIMQAYVMAQQRQVHASFTGASGQAPAMEGGEVTLF